MYEAMKRVMIVLKFDSNDNAEVVFTKELMQHAEDIQRELNLEEDDEEEEDLVGRFIF